MEIPSSKDKKAFLVGVVLPGQPSFQVEEHLEELAELAGSAGMEVVGQGLQPRKAPDPRTFIGRGKVEELATAADDLGAKLLIFDDDLKPKQVRNLEEILEGVTVIDRSALILEIFAQRARTREARTQVELAQLNYMLPRLTRRWTHLSRQVGGIGVRGGEGETQLEADRRMLRRRIRRLKKDLEKIDRSREVQRRGRRGANLVALAGYTNAGKSTLFNRLTRAGTPVRDQLFATLDSKLRRGALDSEGATAIFADTVGFIRKLPHHLVASFRSTLGGIAEGDVVLHVIDRSHPAWDEQRDVGAQVLQELGVEQGRILQVFNKCDRVENGAAPAVAADTADTADTADAGDTLRISAVTGEGIERLKAAIGGRLSVPAASDADHRTTAGQEI